MSAAQVTEAHLKLCQRLNARWTSYEDGAQLIADSEARAIAELRAEAELATERAMSKQYRECWCNQCGKIITAMKEDTK